MGDADPRRLRNNVAGTLGVKRKGASKMARMIHVAAPGDAMVHTIAVDAGQQVRSADVVVVLESAAGQLPMVAGVAGTVAEVSVNAGDLVHAGDPLVVIVED